MQDYGSLPNPTHPPRRRSATIIWSVLVVGIACGSAIVALTALASRGSDLVGGDGILFRIPKSELLMRGGNELDLRYMAGEAAGEGGMQLIKRLQQIWFVGAHSGGLGEYSREANNLVIELMSATFPVDVREHISDEVNPCDDFYDFACGTWENEHRDKIPKYKTSASFAWDKANKHVKDNMLRLLETDEGPAGVYYRSCMDVDAIEKAGATVLDPYLKVIDSIVDHDSLLDAVVAFNKINQDTIFSWFIDRDPANVEQNAFFLTQGSGSFPDRAYYLEDSEEMKTHRDKLQERLEYFFGLIGRKEPEKEAKMVLELETKLALAQVGKAESRKDHGIVVTWDDVQNIVPIWQWHKWIGALAACTGIDETLLAEPIGGGPKTCSNYHTDLAKVGSTKGKPLLMRNKDFFVKMNEIIRDTPLAAIKAEMRWSLIRNSASSMSNTFLEGLVDWNKDLYGTSEKSPRPRKCYFRDNIKAAEDMLDKIRRKFSESLKTEAWMAEPDRQAAEDKLQHMFFQVGVPTNKEGVEDWPEQTHAFDGLMTPSLFHNDMVTNQVEIQRNLKKLAEVPDRRKWGGSTPMAVNAFYGPTNNGLWIPAGILQAPFFDYKMSDARNYGSIGAVLGHEMTHGFDDNGAQYNAKGELQDWWSASTVQMFKTRSQCISDVFSNYSISGRHVQGALTLGEDIADAGGLKFAYQAFSDAGVQRTLDEKRLFFTAFAQTWCSVHRHKSAVSSLLSDPHAPAKFRVLGALSQFEPFSEAFACPVGSPMSPKAKCSLW